MSKKHRHDAIACRVEIQVAIRDLEAQKGLAIETFEKCHERFFTDLTRAAVGRGEVANVDNQCSALARVRNGHAMRLRWAGLPTIGLVFAVVAASTVGGAAKSVATLERKTWAGGTKSTGLLATFDVACACKATIDPRTRISAAAFDVAWSTRAQHAIITRRIAAADNRATQLRVANDAIGA